jgi:hypothetical protein
MSNKLLLVIIGLLVANLVVGVVKSPSDTLQSDTNADGALGLVRPWFIDEALASDDRSARAIADISSEAGMSAYVKSARSINLTNAKRAFTRGVEDQTADYIIGLVPIPGYASEWDAHVLVHRTGWILAYYPNTWVASRTINEKQQTVASTKLSLAIDQVSRNIVQNFPTKSDYNFAHPSATKMLVIHFKNGQDPRLKLPGSFTYYEKSILFYSYNYDDFHIEETKIIDGRWDKFYYLNIDSQLSEGSYIQMYSDSNSSSRSSWGTIVILYS